MSTRISADFSLSFYTASLAALRFLNASLSGRTLFGPDADALWSSFKGDLAPQDRIDLLLRDASVKWGAAFSPAAVFQLSGLAADEPMGPDWLGLDPDRARKAWRDAEALEFSSPLDVLNHVAAAWKLDISSTPAVPPIASATRVLVAGPCATAAAIKTFLNREDLSWSDQILVVGSSPAERHLAGIAGLLVSSAGPTRLLSPAKSAAAAAPADLVRAAGLSAVDLALISPDATPEARNFAQAAFDSLR